MALIRCPECGKEFSDKAHACPNCGCPTDKIVQTQNEISIFDDVFEGNLVSKLNPVCSIAKSLEFSRLLDFMDKILDKIFMRKFMH